MTEASPDLKVDAERPWLGLLPFTEATQRFFFGRDQEIRDGFLRVREHPLTVLYGPSGLGKSSLLGAGLIPKLRVEGYRPALVRLRFEESDPTLLAQVEGALAVLLQPGGEGTAAGEAEVRSSARALWERFHHLPTRPPDLAAAPPVLIFDPFEEIFTLAESSPVRRREAEALFRQLADLIENRPPATLQESLRAKRELAREFDFADSPVRVVLTLREDYLSHLEAWKKTLPALMRNRMGLRLLDGPNALAAVVEPGRLGEHELVSRDVGERIVRFVAERPPETPIDEISAVPPLLSLLCYELNEARIATRAEAISAEQVEQQGTDILQNFYERSFAGLDPAVRRYVEDRMITVGGHRNAVAREDAAAALHEAGIEDPEAALDQLVNGRLLAAEDLGGLKRLEITHDVLAPLAVRSREQRRSRERAERAENEEREAKAREAAARRQRTRLRWLAVAMSVLALAALISAFLAYRTSRRATILLEEATRKALGSARSSFDQQDPHAGLAYLAEALRYRPDNALARKVPASYLVGLPTIGLMPVPLRHDGGVNAAVFSPDGRWVVTASRDKTARVWESASGRPVGKPLRHDGGVNAAVFSPDSRWVVTASEDKTARVWESASGRPVGEPLRHAEQVNLASFSPDGRRVVTASDDKTARVWESASGRPVGEPLRHDEEVHVARFSPDGRWVVTASFDKTARVWDAASGRPVSQPLRHEEAVYDARFSPDGRWVVTASFDKTARVWDAASGQPVSQPLRHDGWVNAAVFSPDGRWVVTTSYDKTARVWDAASGRPIGEPLRHDDKVFAARFSPDGRWVVTASADKTARLWDAASGRPVGEPLRHDGWVTAAVFSPDGRWVVTASADKTARRWEAASGRPVGKPLRHDEEVTVARFSPDGRWVVTASADKTARVWDAASGRPVGKPLGHDERVTAADFSPDGRWVITASVDKTARVWESASGRPVGEPLRHDAEVLAAVFSPDGRWVVTASWDKTARVWDAVSGRPIGEPLRHDDRVTPARFSLDGRWVVTGSLDKTARVWESASGRPVGKPLRHNDRVTAADFSPDGRWVVTASWDKTARVWEAVSGRPIGKPLRHDGEVTRASFSPDGRWVVTASADKTARVWEAVSGRPVGEPLRHDDGVMAARFSPDGRWVVTASSDKTARVWEAASGQPFGEPLRHDHWVYAASFSPDSRWVVTASKDATARVWELTRGVGNEMPAALVALAGRRVSGDGLLVNVPPEERLAWRHRLLATPPDGSEWDRLLRWCVADPRTRTISPHATLTVPQHIEREIDWVMAHPQAENAASILDDAYSLDPTHPLILFALSAFEDNPATRALYRDLGLERLPADARLCARAAEILKAQGDRPRALIAAEKALALEPRYSRALAVQAWARAEPAGRAPPTAAQRTRASAVARRHA